MPCRPSGPGRHGGHLPVAASASWNLDLLDLASLACYSEDQAWPPASHATTQHLEEYCACSRTRKKGYGERKITGDETLSANYLDRQYRQLRRFWAYMVEAPWVPVEVNVLDDMQRPRGRRKPFPPSRTRRSPTCCPWWTPGWPGPGSVPSA